MRIYVGLITMLSFAFGFDLNFNKPFSDGSYLLWREIEFVKKQQSEIISFSIPIVFAHERFTDILIDRDGFISFGSFNHKNILKDQLYRDSNGRIRLNDEIAILTPFKIISNSLNIHSNVRYRLINLSDLLLDCSDRFLVESLAESIRKTYQNNFHPKQALFTSWANMSIPMENFKANPIISFEQSILTDGAETFQIINHISGHQYMPSLPIEEPIAGIYSNIRNQTIRIPLDLPMIYEKKNSFFLIQLDNIDHRNLSGVRYHELQLNETIQTSDKCLNNEIFENIFSTNKSHTDLTKPPFDQDQSQNDVTGNGSFCDTKICFKTAVCQTTANGKCCRCKNNWVGDGVTCVILPSTADSPPKIVYEGNLIIENDNVKLDQQLFRLTKTLNFRQEGERVLVNLEFSSNINFMLTSFAMPTLFLLPMWITATPYDGGKNLIQLTGGSIKFLQSVCGFGKLATFIIEGQSNRIDQNLKGNWAFTVKAYGSQNINHKITDLDSDSQMYTIHFQRNDHVLISSKVSVMINSEKVPFKCRTEIKLDRGCLQEPELENRKMFLIIQRISMEMRPENGAFYVGKAIVTTNPCLVSEAACPMPNSLCIAEMSSAPYKCICSPGYSMINNICDKTYSNFKCVPPCHIDATCYENNMCICNSGHQGDGRFCFNCNVCNRNAECYPETSKCKCKPGFVGSGYECREEVNCDIKCHENASCVNGYCKCNRNLIGDGINSCFDCLKCNTEADCSPYENRCYCRPGYTGNGFTCIKSCDKICHKDALCQNSRCICKPNFEGDGVNYCFDCSKCHKLAQCHPKTGNCTCRPPYVGDGVSECETFLPKGNCFPPCANHAICTVENTCQCRKNYYGNPLEKCNIDCSKCHTESDCDKTNGYCKCRYGFFGDGFTCNKTCCVEKCHEQAQCVDGKCLCKPGFSGDGVETCFHCSQCDSNAICDQNNRACICKSGFEGNGINCLRAINCKQKCHKQARCLLGKCICNKGLSGNGVEYCFNCSSCHLNAKCIPRQNTCECNSGFHGDGIQCKLLPLCTPACHPQASCINGNCKCNNNLIGDGISSCFDCDKCSMNARCDVSNQRCICQPGYEGNGIKCVKTCFQSCHKLAVCKEGTCKCSNGLTGDGVNYCFNCSLCDKNAKCLINEEKCECMERFEGDGFTCQDKVDCSSLCGENAFCYNGTCKCKLGFQGNPLEHCFDCRVCHYPAYCDIPNRKCICITENDIFSRTPCSFSCHPNAKCIKGRCRCLSNLIGNGTTYCFNCSSCARNSDCKPEQQTCTCKRGYVKDGNNCSIISARCLPECGVNAQCINGKCECLAGLQGNPFQQCFDCKRCSQFADCDPWNERCVCQSGYIGNGFTCTKIINCVTKCHVNGFCGNQECKCLPGLIGDGINFCFDCSTCDINAFCEPFNERCVCSVGFTGNGKKCSILAPITCKRACHKKAKCVKGKCECLPGLRGDGVQSCFDCSICDNNTVCYPDQEKCVCNPGYYGDGTTCFLFSQLCTEKCHPNAKCVNRKCKCNERLVGDGVNFCFNCTSCHPDALCFPDQQQCSCKSEFVGDGKICTLRADICRPTCGENAICVNRQCQCQSGLQGNPLKNCFDCRPCHSFAVCDVENRRCICQSGFEGDGRNCKKIKECSPKCHRNAVCINQNCVCIPEYIGDGINFCFNCSSCDRNADCEPYNHRCVCKSGYVGDGNQCFRALPDICRPTCGENAICVNGQCQCQSGLQGNPLKHCFDCRPCHSFAVCDVENRRCICQSGFEGDGRNCKKIKECSPKCHRNAVCINQNCVCIPEYIGDGINFCFNCSSCDRNADCEPYNHRCVCKSGYVGDGNQCFRALPDICRPTCGENAICVNGQCQCQSGLQGNPLKHCFDCRPCHSFAVCDVENRRCICQSGFEGDGQNCKKIEECSPKCHRNAVCINQNCVCIPEYIGDGINFCFNCSSCDRNADCEPHNNRCTCYQGFTGNGLTCNAIELKCEPSCGENAKCVNGKCECLPGLQGNPLQHCFNCKRCDKFADCDVWNKKCVCKNGYMGNGLTCISVNGCNNKCDSNALCVNRHCICLPGFTGDGTRFCFDCSSCPKNSNCLPEEQKCICQEGYIMNGAKCQPIVHECRPGCGENAKCVNGKCECLPGLQGNPMQHCFDCKKCHKFADCDVWNKKCVCKNGYFGNGYMCTPINGCNLKCDENALCVNQKCICLPGFIGDGIKFCFDCSACPVNSTCLPEEQRCMAIKPDCNLRCGENARCVQDKCECFSGFQGNPLQHCVNCEACSKFADCDLWNKRCVCKNGYIGNGFVCSPINGCNFNCDPNALCVNKQCICLPGFVGNGKFCFDCATCPSNSNCFPEQKKCICKENYFLNKTQCSAIPKQCHPDCGENAKCVNGKCECLPGLQGNPMQHCFDCKKCHKFADCDVWNKKCVCKSGYFGNGYMCTPINGCNLKCNENALCVNQKCICLPGFIGDGIKFCFDCSACPVNSNCVPEKKECKCAKDYFMNEKICSPIKQPVLCTSKCHKNAKCLKGNCECLPGFVGDGIQVCFNCSTCDKNANCFPYQERCVCKPRYSGNGENCVKIGPESICPNKCHKKAKCDKKKCKCLQGFSGDGIKTCFNCSSCSIKAICVPDQEKCICKAGFSGNGDQCVENIEGSSPKCHSNALRVNQQCICLPGFIGDGKNFCFDCSTCPPNSDCLPQEQRCICKKDYFMNDTQCIHTGRTPQCVPKCHHYASCVQDKCECLPGFIGDGIKFCFKCSSCDPNADCVPEQQKCVCKTGFYGNGNKCDKIESTCEPPCAPGGFCNNSKCQCNSGLKGDGATSCFNCSKCDVNAKCFPSVKKCICVIGYKGDGFRCYPVILECPKCHYRAQCVIGKCQCKNGLQGDGINFCMNCSECDKNAQCFPNFSKCECRQGYRGDGKNCVKIDECSPKCHQNAVCINSNCHCLPMYTGNGVSFCFNCAQCDANAICKPDENLCVCAQGFTGNGITCKAIDPSCKTNCHKDALCFKDSCICKSGLSGDGKNYCFDCKRCDQNAICRPTEQRCVCKPEFRGDGFQCALNLKTTCQNDCHPNAVRVNNCCRCKNGFFGDGFSFCFNCSNCSPNADCFPHLSKCQCKEEFTGNGFICQRKECKPACSEATSLCIKNQCFCRPGLIGDGYNCLDCRKCHEKATCNIRSMKCECLPGYIGNGFECISITSCTQSSDCIRPNEICNVAISQCICEANSFLDPISKLCINPNCQPPCHPKAVCVKGKCICNRNLVGDGYQCRAPEECNNDADCVQFQEVCRKDQSSLKKICKCKDGLVRDLQGQCQKPACNGACHSKAVCVKSSNLESRCLCLPGFVGDGMTTCTDCSGCDKNAICTEKQGCICKSGFIGDGRQCIVLNECADNSDCTTIRGRASECIRSSEGIQKCQCSQGFKLLNGKCEPLSCIYPCAKNAVCIYQKCECLPGLVGNGFIKCTNCSECHKKALCHDQRGCVCSQGYSGDGIQCRIEDQCSLNSDCTDPNKICITSTDTVKRCVCKSSFISSNSGCVPLTCLSKCHKYANCENGVCKCILGYVGDGIICRLPDECKSSLDCKYENQECVARLDSSLMCTCKSGFQWQSEKSSLVNNQMMIKRSMRANSGCVPIDCNPKCHRSALCVIGTCKCPPSFKGNGYSGCFDCSKCHANADCDESKGCTCKPGFEGNGCYCRPEDKCKFNSDCNDPLKICVQSPDTSRNCVCKPGTTPSTNGKCIILGCPVQCDKNAVCLSNNCVCKTGYSGTGLNCKPNDQCSQNSDCPGPNSRCEMMKDYNRKCVCLPGFQDDNGKCSPKECQPKCHMFAICITQTCYCVPGYFGDGIKSCTSCSVCHKNAQCLPDRGCVCKSDFIGDGFNCRPLDECRINEDCRDPNKMCLLNPSMKNLQCTCKPLHILINNYCLPKECTSKCHKNAKCEGGMCQCLSGFIGDGINCQRPFECGIDNPCKDQFSVCQLTSDAKRFVCVCVFGFQMINSKCQPEPCPINCHPLAQCKSGKCVCQGELQGDGIRTCFKCSSCHARAVCSMDGCKCMPGYVGNGIVCQTEDQCQYDSDCRDRNAACFPGVDKGKKCQCKPGFSLENSLCSPIACRPKCGKNSQCQLGVCVCKDGYSPSVNGLSCSPIDHCQSENDCPDSNHKCVYHGLFQGKRCMCRKGFIPKSVFQCIEETCPNKCHNFAYCRQKVCQCRLGFQGDGVFNCHDCSVCHPNAICSPSLGCTCPGPHLIGDGRSCKPKDQCRIDSDCRDSNAVCTLTYDSLKCQCKLGYIKFNNSLCYPIPCVKQCDRNEECLFGQCQCKPGFIHNSNKTCVEPNDCDVNNPASCKSPLEVCLGFPNAKAICVCRKGFINKFGYCIPINCYQPCHKNAYCNIGVCTCNPDYIGDGITSCKKKNLCLEDSDCPIIGSKCMTKSNPYSCKCPSGYEIDNNKCIAKKCLLPCDPNAVCVLGECICKVGFTGNGLQCMPTSKCNPLSGCSDTNSVCIQVPPTNYYDCMCKPGYIKSSNLSICKPIVCEPSCHPKAACIIGSCICMKPLIGNGITECKLPDECSASVHCKDKNAFCKNSTEGQMKCICKHGFQLENSKCISKEECRVNVDCPTRKICVNSKCICPEQYTSSPDGKLCELPMIMVVPSKLDVPETKDVEVLCFFENGIGNVNYLSWRRISPLMTMNFIRQPASVKLIIQKATVGDSGIYQCCIDSNSSPLNCKFASVNIFTKKCSPCSLNQHCDPVTSNCICDAGFQFDSNGICQRRNCLYFPEICDQVTMICDKGNCVCKSELYMDNKVCVPKDQCKTNEDCDPNAICKTDKRCHCRVLFNGPGKFCAPIKLGCEVTKDCDPNGECFAIGISPTRLCQCKPGYVGDGKTCKPAGQMENLLISQGHYIWKLPSLKRKKRSIIESKSFNPFLWKQLIPGDKISIMDSNCKSRFIYWILENSPGIFNSSYSSPDSGTTILLKNIKVSGMAIDWISGNLFWTSKSDKNLGVFNTQSGFEKIIFSSLTSPGEITINSKDGEMFWICHTRNFIKIDFAYMDGTGYRPLIANFIFPPQALTYDSSSDKLCWIENDMMTSLNSISCLHSVVKEAILIHNEALEATSTTIEKVYQAKMGTLFSLKLVSSKFIWTGQKKKNYLYVYDSKKLIQYTDVKSLDVEYSSLTVLLDECEKITNSCSNQNVYGNCRYICLPSKNQGRICDCPLGMEGCVKYQ